MERQTGQDDWAAWSTFTTKVGGPTQVVGDDLTVTNVSRVKKAIDDKAGRKKVGTDKREAKRMVYYGVST